MKNKKWMWIEIAAIVLCAAAIILYVFFHEPSAPQKSPEDVTESTSDMTTTAEETKETEETEETQETEETSETEEASEAEETSETEEASEAETTSKTEPETTELVTTATETTSKTEPETTELMTTATEAQTTEPITTEPVTTAPPETEMQTTKPITTAPPETDPPVTECSHSYVTTTVEATCAKEGRKTHVCSQCGHSYSETVKITDEHVAGSWKVTKSATCTEAGSKAKSCTVCGKTLKTAKIEALGHSLNEGVITTAPTCSAEGVKTFTCETCGHSDTETVAATGEHQWTVTKAVNVDPYSDDFEKDGEQVCDLCQTTEVIKGWQFIEDTYGLYSDAYLELVEHRMLYYFNKWRVEEGVSATTWLPRQREYARYRAMQLTTNFAHDRNDEKAAATALKYGRYFEGQYQEKYDFDTGLFYISDEWVPAHYFASGGEAILKGGMQGDVDGSGYHMANVLRNSKGHWNGIGSEAYVYMSVGIVKNSVSTYTCVIMNTAEEGLLYEQVLGP